MLVRVGDLVRAVHFCSVQAGFRILLAIVGAFLAVLRPAPLQVHHTSPR